MKRALKFIIPSYLGVFILLTLLWISGNPSDCTAGQEVAEGCEIRFPDTYLWIALVSVLPGLFVAGIANIAIKPHKQSRKDS
jgi:hypothetical protein